MMEQESGRCRRTDGKKWRCSKEALAEQKYCENHIHRGRKRSRKHSEAALDFKSSTTSTKHPIYVTDTKLSESLSNPPLATINTLVNNVKKNANNDMDRRKEDNNVQSLFTTSGQIFRLDVNNNDDKRKRSENGYGEGKSSDRCNIIRNKFNLESMNKGDKSNAHVAPLVTGFPLRSNHHVGGTSMTGNTLLAEERRCRRTDGKKWRCSREVVANQKYCVSHMHRGAKRYAGTGLRANMFAPHHHAVAGIEVEEEDEVNTRLCISPAMNLGLFRRRGSSPSHSNGSSSDATTITDENGCVCP